MVKGMVYYSYRATYSPQLLLSATLCIPLMPASIKFYNLKEAHKYKVLVSIKKTFPTTS